MENISPIVWQEKLSDKMRVRLRKKALNIKPSYYDQGLYTACFTSDHIGASTIIYGQYEHNFLHALFNNILKDEKNNFESSTALDVGANIGGHTCYFSKFFNRVIAFEPSPLPRHICNANVLANKLEDRVFIEPVGLGNKDEQLSFSPYKDNDLGKGSFSNFGHLDEKDLKEMPTLDVRIGDKIIEKKYAQDEISFIKLDIEGFELFALQGLENTIKKHKPFIVFESSGATKEEYSGQAIVDFLKRFGYSSFFSIERAKKPKIKFLRKIYNQIVREKLFITNIEEVQAYRRYDMIIASCKNIS